MERTLKRVLITGATGMIGATLTRLLRKENIEVVALVHSGSKKLSNLPVGEKGLLIVACDLSRTEELTVPHKNGRALLPLVDAVFHFAWDGAYGEKRNDLALQERNLLYTENVLRLGAKLGAKVFIGAGSQAEYGPVSEKLTPETPCHPVTGYGIYKGKARERGLKLAETLGIDFIWTRILSVYGPYDNDYTMVMSAVRAFEKKEHLAFTKGEQIWDYLFSEDAAHCFLELAKKGRNGKTYVLGSGREKTLAEYVTDIRNATDPTAEIGLGERPYYENQVMVLTADVSALKEDTGYTPSTAFPDGIKKTVAWYRKKGQAT